MNNQLQSQILKKCNSCKRSLHVCYFGICPKTKDGFNPTCRGCRNYRRRRDYHKAAFNEELIWPLRDNNSLMLCRRLGEASEVQLPALNHMDNSKCLVTIRKEDLSLYTAKIESSNNTNLLYLTTSCKDDLISLIVPILTEKCIRLLENDLHGLLILSNR